jgi:hypothetical protein
MNSVSIPTRPVARAASAALLISADVASWVPEMVSIPEIYRAPGRLAV